LDYIFIADSMGLSLITLT